MSTTLSIYNLHHGGLGAVAQLAGMTESPELWKKAQKYCNTLVPVGVQEPSRSEWQVQCYTCNGAALRFALMATAQHADGNLWQKGPLLMAVLYLAASDRREGAMMSEVTWCKLEREYLEVTEKSGGLQWGNGWVEESPDGRNPWLAFYFTPGAKDLSPSVITHLVGLAVAQALAFCLSRQAMYART